MNLERLRFPSVDGPAWSSQHGCLADTSPHSLICHRAQERRMPTEKPQHRNSCIFQGQKSRRTQLSNRGAHTRRPGARLIRTPGTKEAKTHREQLLNPSALNSDIHMLNPSHPSRSTSWKHGGKHRIEPISKL